MTAVEDFGLPLQVAVKWLKQNMLPADERTVRFRELWEAYESSRED